MLSVKAHLQCSELPLLQSTLEKVDSWDISSPQKTADEVSWRCWWRPVSFSLCCFHNLQEPSPLQPWQALAPGRPQRTAGMKKQGAGLPWGIGWQPAQVMERRLGQRLLTRVPSAEEACWSGTGRENPSGCPQPLTGPQTQQASMQCLWQPRQSVQPPLGNRPPPPPPRWGDGEGDKATPRPTPPQRDPPNMAPALRHQHPGIPPDRLPVSLSGPPLPAFPRGGAEQQRQDGASAGWVRRAAKVTAALSFPSPLTGLCLSLCRSSSQGHEADGREAGPAAHLAGHERLHPRWHPGGLAKRWGGLRGGGPPALPKQLRTPSAGEDLEGVNPFSWRS